MPRRRPPLEAWDVSPPEILERTRLYNLPPIGIGTAHVERIGSYLARLAATHCITPRNLVEFHFGLGGFKHLYVALSGFGLSAASVVATTQLLTGRSDLSNLTLLPLRAAFAGKGLLRETRAWCPACYRKQRDKGEINHDALLWTIRAIHVCASHRTRLREECANCGYESRPHDLLAYPGWCSRCGCWLGLDDRRQRADQERPAIDRNWEVWKSRAVGELLAGIPELPSLPSKDTVQSSLRTLLRQTGATGSVFHEAVGMSPRHYWACLLGESRISFDRFLRVAWATGTTPLALLAGKFEATGLRAAPDTTKRPYDRPSSRAGVEARWQWLESNARAALRRVPPVSTAQLAAEFGVSTRYLRDVLPNDLKRDLRARYRSEKESHWKRVKEARQTARDRITAELIAQGMYPSENLVTRMVRELQIR